MKNNSKESILEKDYFNDLNRIKETIRQNQAKAMVYVNSQMILTYYEIGTIINKRKTWGSKYIKNLANDLKEYGKGYSIQNLKYMSQIACEYTIGEISHQLGGQIPWRTLIEITSKSKSHEEMLFYINATHKNGWSRSMVLNQIELKSYESSLVEPDTASIVNSTASFPLVESKKFLHINLYRMSKFANELSIGEICHQAGDQISHYSIIKNINLDIK